MRCQGGSTRVRRFVTLGLIWLHNASDCVLRAINPPQMTRPPTQLSPSTGEGSGAFWGRFLKRSVKGHGKTALLDRYSGYP